MLVSQNHRSIDVFGDATPSASMRIASLPRTTPSLDVANPGTSLTRIVVLPIASPTAVAACIVSSEHESCLISSSNFMIGTGLKKCIPMTFSGLPDAAAISEIDSEDVFVPRINPLSLDQGLENFVLHFWDFRNCFNNQIYIFDRISHVRECVNIC